MQGWMLRSVLFQFFTLMPVHGIRPMVSYRAIELGAGPVDLGIVAASYAILSFVLAVPLGGGVDRVGEPRFLLGGSMLIVAMAGVLTTADSIPVLVVAQALLGLGQITSAIGLQALVANRGDPAERDRRLGTFAVTGALGQMVGPTAAGLLFAASGESLAVVFLVAAVSAGTGIAMATSILLRPPPRMEFGSPAARDPSVYRTAGTVLRQPMVPHAMLASVTVLTTIDLLIAYLPLYGEANGISVETVGVLLGVRAAAGMASRLLMMPLLRRVGRRGLLAYSMMLPAACLLALPLVTSTALLFGLIGLAGFGLGLGQPLSLAWVAAQVPVNMRGTAIGVRLTGNRLGQLVVPGVVGVIAGATGLAAIFVTAGAMLGAASTVVFDRRRPADESVA